MNSELKTEQPTFTESVHDIIVEQTDNGARIVSFLLAAMEGQFPDFQPCHKLEAARLLEKFGHGTLPQSVGALTGDLNLPQPTRQERRDARRADRRIHSELAQIVQQETDNGRTIVTFLVNAMDGEFADFKPCHRMSACKELLHRGSQYEEETVRPEHVEGHVEETDPEEERLRRAEHQRRREEAVEFSLHGKTYYDVHPWHCPCEDRLHDCEGNELRGEDLEAASMLGPAETLFIEDPCEMEAYKARYREYLTRLNPNKDIDTFIANIRWEDP